MTSNHFLLKLYINLCESKQIITQRFMQLQRDLQGNKMMHEALLCSDAITLFIGGYQFTPQGMAQLSVNELIQRSDDSLYQVKNKGRNNIFIATD